MQSHPYVFRRGGEIVATLAPNGAFNSNADGAGWFEYDSLLDFFQDAGVEIHPTDYITQVSELVNALPEIDLAAMQAQAQAPAPVQVQVAPVAPVAPSRPKRGRAAKAPAGVEAQAQAQAQTPVNDPTPIPTAPIPQAGTPAPTTNPLQDPAVQAFLASQKAAAITNPPLPVPVAANYPPAPPAGGAITTRFTSDGNPAPAPQATAPTPTPARPPKPTAPPVQLPTASVTLAVDELIQAHGIANVAGAFVEWATTGAAAAEKYGLVETAKRLRGVASAHAMAQGL